MIYHKNIPVTFSKIAAHKSFIKFTDNICVGVSFLKKVTRLRPTDASKKRLQNTSRPLPFISELHFIKDSA